MKTTNTPSSAQYGIEITMTDGHKTYERIQAPTLWLALSAAYCRQHDSSKPTPVSTALWEIDGQGYKVAHVKTYYAE